MKAAGALGSQAPVAAKVPTVMWESYTKCPVPYIKLLKAIARKSTFA
jgi:hypothetical protein